MIDRENDSTFDFYGQNAEKQRQEVLLEQKKRHENFMNMGKKALLAVGLAATVFGVSYGGYKAYENNVNNKIIAAETIIKSTPKFDVLNFMQKERTVLQKTYAANQMLIGDHGQYKDVIQVLNLGDQLSRHNAINAKLYKESTNLLDKDVQSLVKIYDTIGANRDTKIANYLDGGVDLNVLNKWTDKYKNKQFMYAGGLLNLHNDLNKNIAMLDQTQKEIIAHVQERIKNKDFDLNAAQAKFTQDVSQDADKEVNELKQVRKELVETNDLAAEDSDGNMVVANPNLQNMLTDNDVKTAEESMGIYKKEALNQITQDKAAVEKMINDAKNDNQTTAPVVAANTNVNTNTPTVIHHHSGPSFFDYYMMYHWMNASPSVVNNNTYVNTNAANTNGAAGAARHNYQAVPAVVQNAKPYDLRNQSSHLNQSLSQSPQSANSSGKSFQSVMGKYSPSNVNRPNLTSIKSQIDAVKSKASQASSARASEIGRMKAVNTYEGGGKRALGSKSSVSKSVSSRSMSSSSRGGFGSHGSSSGHSGGFGG